MRRKLNIVIVLMFALATSLSGQRGVKLNFCEASADEMAPFKVGNTLYYISNRKMPEKLGGEVLDTEHNKPAMNIFSTTERENRKGKYERGQLVSDQLRSRFFDGPATFTADGTMICFFRTYTRDTPGFEENGKGGLFFGYYENDEWVNVEPFEHNRQEISYNCPALSSDGMVLYFAADSNMPGSLGDWDIYVSYFIDGAWSEPENMGPKVNSSNMEYFPYLHSSGRLYFSRYLDLGRGFQMDVYYSDRHQGVWSEAAPFSRINSSTYNEYGLYITPRSDSVFYTRNLPSRSSDIYLLAYNYEQFDLSRPIEKDHFCFRLRETTMDTIDSTMFDYEWVITEPSRGERTVIPGHDVKHCFPGPGDYVIKFNVTNKITDTVMLGVFGLEASLNYQEQVQIIAPDTIEVNEPVTFRADPSHWTRYDIDEFYWDFDGNKGTDAKGEEVEYTYTAPGTYNVIVGITEDVTRNPDKHAFNKEFVVVRKD